MSGSESGSASDEEMLEFRCRKCPGKTFTAAEKDAHRMFHRQQKGRRGRPKIGPKSKTSRASRGRSPSPATSAVTLFEAVDQPAATRRGERRKAPEEASNPSKKPKRKSNKSYDDAIVGDWVQGTGA